MFWVVTAGSAWAWLGALTIGARASTKRALRNLRPFVTGIALALFKLAHLLAIENAAHLDGGALIAVNASVAAIWA